jgi:hypothetical protein
MFARLFAKTLELELNLKTNSAAAVLNASAAPVYALSSKLFFCSSLIGTSDFILVTSAAPRIGQVYIKSKISPAKEHLCCSK